MAAKPLTPDIAIVGAGLVGMTAAIAMHQCGQQVLLIDRAAAPKRFQPKNNQDWDSRIYAISPQNVQWLTGLGVWQRLDPQRVTSMTAMHIWGDQTQTPLDLVAEDVPVDALGYIVESAALLDACYQVIKSLGVVTLFNRTCESLQNDTEATRLIIRAKTRTQIIEPSLLIAADGANSWVRQQLNFVYQHKPYAQKAIVANFKVEHAHDGVARQWFRQQESGLDILAWLPMPDQHISIVWSLPSDVAGGFMQLSNEQLTAQVAQAGQFSLGEMQMVTPPASFPLSVSGVTNPVDHCVLLFGDAFHRIHPLAGQGVNLGFRDVAQWQQLLQAKHTYQTLNDPQLCKQFVRQRKVDVAAMLTLTDGLYKLFNTQQPVLKSVRHWGFEATKHKALKSLLVKQAVGQ